MELPDELWVLIFRKYLDGNDTIRFREVSKRFKFLIDQFCLSELLVFNKWFGPTFVNHTEDKEPDLWVRVSKFKPDSSFQMMFSRLKFLHVDNALSKFRLNFFNKFTSLEKLILRSVCISKNQSLGPPNLKVLSISLCTLNEARDTGKVQERVDYSREPRLTLKSKVQTLFCSYKKFDVLKLEHPGCIEVIDCTGGVNEQMLARLKNLRILRMNKLELAKLSKPEFIDAFEKLGQLEELHLDVSLREGDDRLIGEVIGKLTSLGPSLKRTLKLTFLGIPFPFPFPLEGPITWGPQGTSIFYEWNFRFANYHKLGHVRCPRIPYDYLISSLDQQRDRLTNNGVALNEKGFPACFFEKHLNIIEVTVHQTVDEERFLWFLSQCTRLRTLVIKAHHLSETLLSGLPMSCGHLKSLYIYGADFKMPQIDLSPICKLSLLHGLYIRAQISACPFDLALLFEQCRQLEYVELGYIRIQKETLYKVSFYNIASFINQTYDPICLTYTREQLLANVNKHAQEGKERVFLIKMRQAAEAMNRTAQKRRLE